MRFDHDHDTKQFRGWLCHQCNAGIGLLGDGFIGLLRAIDYLNRAYEDMSLALDRNYLGSQNNNGFFSSGVANAYPFVSGNNNQPGIPAQTPALVQEADGARLQGTPALQQFQAPNAVTPATPGGGANPAAGASSQNFIQQGVSPVGVGSAPTDNTLEDAGISGVGTPLMGMANGLQEHYVAVHTLGV
jgi:hypothetical protein